MLFILWAQLNLMMDYTPMHDSESGRLQFKAKLRYGNSICVARSAVSMKARTALESATPFDRSEELKDIAGSRPFQAAGE